MALQSRSLRSEVMHVRAVGLIAAALLLMAACGTSLRSRRHHVSPPGSCWGSLVLRTDTRPWSRRMRAAPHSRFPTVDGSAAYAISTRGDDDDAGVEATSTAVASPDAAPTESPTIIAATATPPRGSPTATISEAEKEHGLRESLQDAMDASVSGYENFVGGVAVAVRGEPPVVVTMGKEVDPEGIFLIASITKTFTSTVILQLMEEGLLDLDDPIEALLPGGLEGESITVRHLLTHQSGLHSYTSADFRQDFTENPERRWLPLDVISPYLDRDRLSEPGEVYSYSNTNFIILGMVIEAVSGNPVSAAIR